jgi:hypothetical protein
LLGAPLEMPPGAELAGDGMNLSVLLFAGTSGLVARSPPESYEQAGSVRDLMVQGGGGAGVGLFLEYRQHLLLERVRFAGFGAQSVLLTHSIMCSLRGCLVQGGGNAHVASVEVESSTAFLWDHCRVSAGNPDCCAGLRLDAVAPFELRGGALESCGVCLQLAANPAVATRTGPGRVHCLDMENPRGRYVEAGLGWQGPPGVAVKEVTFANCSMTPSGSTTVTRGFVLANTWACRLEQCNVGTLPGGADVELLGANLAFSLGVNGTPDASQQYLLRDGVPVPGAVRQKPYES